MVIQIKSIGETVELIKTSGASIARFGDGEVDIMTGKSIPYQSYDSDLAAQLKTILQRQSDTQFLVGLPDVFEHLERYNDFCQKFWEGHLAHYHDFYRQMLTSSWYVTTFLSRPYIDLAQKKDAYTSFKQIRSLWENRDILIVEGETSRSGVGNDLFSNAQHVSRIICPSHNAYASYDEIIQSIRINGKEKLILLMLGPTAKVLAYDLFKEGYQALDIGHIDSEYEWFQMKADHKVKLNHKHTAEYNYDENIVFEEDSAYNKSIVDRITTQRC